MRRPKLSMDSAMWDETGIAFDRHHALEHDVLAWVMVAPMTFVPIAKRSGVTPALFIDDAFRCAWVVFAEWPEKSIDELLCLSRNLARRLNAAGVERAYDAVSRGELIDVMDLPFSGIREISRELLMLHGLMMKAFRLHRDAVQAIRRASCALPLTLDTNAFHYQPARATEKAGGQKPGLRYTGGAVEAVPPVAGRMIRASGPPDRGDVLRKHSNQIRATPTCDPVPTKTAV